MEEQEVERKIAATHLHRKFRADEAEVAAEFAEEGAKLGQQATVQIGLGVAGLQVEELDRVGVLEGFPGGDPMQLCQRC